MSKIKDNIAAFHAAMDYIANPPLDCNAHTKGDGSWWEYDARGIELCRVCAKCRKRKLADFRPDVLSDPNYWTDEPIESD